MTPPISCCRTKACEGKEIHNAESILIRFRQSFPGSPPPPPPYLIFVIFLHSQIFWRMKFTPKKRVNYDKIHSELPIFCVITAKYTVNCQIFALNLKKFTPAKKNLHEYIRGARDKYEVWSPVKSLVKFSPNTVYTWHVESWWQCRLTPLAAVISAATLFRQARIYGSLKSVEARHCTDGPWRVQWCLKGQPKGPLNAKGPTIPFEDRLIMS